MDSLLLPLLPRPSLPSCLLCYKKALPTQAIVVTGFPGLSRPKVVRGRGVSKRCCPLCSAQTA